MVRIVGSSNVLAVGYEPWTREMRIAFWNKYGPPSLYSYPNIPAAVHAGLMSAGSKGSYVQYVIRRQYPGYRIG